MVVGTVVLVVLLTVDVFWVVVLTAGVVAVFTGVVDVHSSSSSSTVLCAFVLTVVLGVVAGTTGVVVTIVFGVVAVVGLVKTVFWVVVVVWSVGRVVVVVR